jgi:hydrogenase expression/formation protein HypE
MTAKKILLDHGSGGLASQELITGIFLPRFSNPVLADLEDSAVLETAAGRLAFTTDSYVVDPIFFPGGDIGALAVNGTINDLAMRGADPLCLSVGLILEEGFPVEDLERVVDSMAEASKTAGVPVVAGDTKVVPRGKADKIFVNTSGIGVVPAGVEISSSMARPGDLVLLSGTMADHGITILTRRAGLALQGDLRSDTMALHGLVKAIIAAAPGGIHTLRDPTRGGLATSLSEIARKAGVEIEIDEAAVPLRPGVRSACEILGLDPFYLANEGKCLALCAGKDAGAVLQTMHSRPEGRDAAIIGRVGDRASGRVILKTTVGGARLMEALSGEPLPRIC